MVTQYQNQNGNKSHTLQIEWHKDHVKRRTNLMSLTPLDVPAKAGLWGAIWLDALPAATRDSVEVEPRFTGCSPVHCVNHWTTADPFMWNEVFTITGQRHTSVVWSSHTGSQISGLGLKRDLQMFCNNVRCDSQQAEITTSTNTKLKQQKQRRRKCFTQHCDSADV